MPKPVQAALIVQTPDPIIVSAPDTAALILQYEAEILPLSKYAITTPQEYVQGNLDWQKAKAFSTAIDDLFDKPCKLAHAAHKALTSLREQLKAPTVQIAAHVGDQLIKFKAEEDRKRREEEARLQAAEVARQELERQRLQAIADAERQQAEAARTAALGELQPWEVDEDTEAALPVVPDAVVIDLPPPAPVRLPSSVPTVLGGPRMVDKPWECVIDDPVAVLRWVLEKPDERIPLYVEFKYARPTGFHSKATELGEDISRVIPGTRAVRGTSLRK